MDSNNTFLGSVIVPVYNEEKKLPDLLDTLTADTRFEIIIVCNGCKDRSVEIAQQYEDKIKLVVLEDGSKVKALNAGDKAATCFPRFYLDADIRMSLDDMAKITAYMAEHKLMAAGAMLDYDYQNKSWPVRWYYKIWTQLPYISDMQHVGSGLYVLDERGRSKFDEFPDIISDDGYINSLYSADEKSKVPSVTIKLDVPFSVFNLMKIKARATSGFNELDAAGLAQKETHNRKGDIFKLMFAKPGNILPGAWYMALQIANKVYGRLFYRNKQRKWLRDESNR